MKKLILIFIFLILCSGCIKQSPDSCTSSTCPIQNATVPLQNLTITFIDVSQGDSEWITTPSGNTMLIDSGESDKTGKIVSSYITVRTIDAVVATHAHEDHIGGMEMVLTMYDINEFYDSGYPHTSKTYENMLTLIDNKRIKYTTVKNGDKINLDPAIDISVLNPQSEFFKDINDNSIVLLVQYRNVSFLLTGDAGLNAETMYVKKLGKVDVLKVGHHGSVTSTGPYLLSKTKPPVSIMSVGKGNSYGHPDASTIKHLTSGGSLVYRTDTNGTIVITTNGEDYSIKTEW
jgi:competence protein ComEC